MNKEIYKAAFPGLFRHFYEQERCWMMAFTEDDDRVERVATKWARRQADRFMRNEAQWDKDMRRYIGKIQSHIDRQRNRDKAIAAA